MFRFKTLVSDSLRSRTFDQQNTETLIGVAVLNRMTHLEMPAPGAIRT
jgi:hypothetical protein